MANVTWFIPGYEQPSSLRFPSTEELMRIGLGEPLMMYAEYYWNTTGSVGFSGSTGRSQPWSKEYKKQNQHLFRRKRKR